MQISILSCRPFAVVKFPHTYFIVQKTRLIPAHRYLLTIALEEAYNFYTLFYLVGATLDINATLSTWIERTGSIATLFNDRKNPSINIVLFFYLLYNLLQNRLGYTFYKFHIQMQ